MECGMASIIIQVEAQLDVLLQFIAVSSIDIFIYQLEKSLLDSCVAKKHRKMNGLMQSFKNI